MSTYDGQHGVNLHNYIHNLNQIRYEEGHFAQPANPSIIEDNLAMFTNTDFIEHDITSLRENSEGDYNFDLGTPYPSPANMKSTYNSPIQPSPLMNGLQIDQLPRPSAKSSPQAYGSSLRRKAEGNASPVVSAEEATRHAAEEDKRHRNTAASARFRVKKKQREQIIEKTVKEAQDKKTKLEARIVRLEIENRWLKGLVTERNDAKFSRR